MTFSATAPARSGTQHSVLQYFVLWMGNRWVVRTNEGRIIGFASSRGGALGIATRAVEHDNANGGNSGISVEDDLGVFHVMQ